MDQQTKLDGIAAVCAVGGAIAATITHSVAAAAFPLAGAVMLQIVNRKQLMKEMNHREQNVTQEIDLIKQQNQFNLFSEKIQFTQSNFSIQINHI